MPGVGVVVEGLGDEGEPGKEGGVLREGFGEGEGVGVVGSIVGVGGRDAEEAVSGCNGREEDVGGLAVGVCGVGKGAHEPGVVVGWMVGKAEVFEGEEGDGLAKHGDGVVGEEGGRWRGGGKREI